MAIANLPDEEFKIMVIKMLTQFGKRINTVKTSKRQKIQESQMEVTEKKTTELSENYSRDLQQTR